MITSILNNEVIIVNKIKLFLIMNDIFKDRYYLSIQGHVYDSINDKFIANTIYDNVELIDGYREIHKISVIDLITNYIYRYNGDYAYRFENGSLILIPSDVIYDDQNNIYYLSGEEFREYIPKMDSPDSLILIKKKIKLYISKNAGVFLENEKTLLPWKDNKYGMPGIKITEKDFINAKNLVASTWFLHCDIDDIKMISNYNWKFSYYDMRMQARSNLSEIDIGNQSFAKDKILQTELIDYYEWSKTHRPIFTEIKCTYEDYKLKYGITAQIPINDDRTKYEISKNGVIYDLQNGVIVPPVHIDDSYGSPAQLIYNLSPLLGKKTLEDLLLLSFYRTNSLLMNIMYSISITNNNCILLTDITMSCNSNLKFDQTNKKILYINNIPFINYKKSDLYVSLDGAIFEYSKKLFIRQYSFINTQKRCYSLMQFNYNGLYFNTKEVVFDAWTSIRRPSVKLTKIEHRNMMFTDCSFKNVVVSPVESMSKYHNIDRYKEVVSKCHKINEINKESLKTFISKK